MKDKLYTTKKLAKKIGYKYLNSKKIIKKYSKNAEKLTKEINIYEPIPGIPDIYYKQ